MDFCPEKNKASMIVFIVSEGFFFLMLIFAYLYYNYTPRRGADGGEQPGCAQNAHLHHLPLGEQLYDLALGSGASNADGIIRWCGG